ncbi:hypothetical protein FISHEDRAFT_73117 [Fistulina hepatica ATCC 64428]|uniref:Uncharacterized protein n=1 Tax=Fistulina hepatica ATCC 64428 TaxID=1128425 RepID=A0A0D7AGF2_9AGAR|nr:hypothetical protein FISHEDRAFT_73117 [Fistulina hepatica ATCC 64428]
MIPPCSRRTSTLAGKSPHPPDTQCLQSALHGPLAIRGLGELGTDRRCSGHAVVVVREQDVWDLQADEDLFILEERMRPGTPSTAGQDIPDKVTICCIRRRLYLVWEVTQDTCRSRHKSTGPD